LHLFCIEFAEIDAKISDIDSERHFEIYLPWAE
jgi:hypothetical protein